MIIIYTTHSDQNALEDIAAVLLKEKLIACANIRGAHTAMYRWEGDVQKEQEYSVLFKTTKEVADKAVERIGVLHSYDCPCILAFEAEASPSFLEWAEDEVSSTVP